MTNVITTYGGGEIFTLVFNGIAALFKQDSTGMVMPLIRVGLMVGLVYVVILILFRQQLVEGIRWFLWVVVATNLIFLPKTTIFIYDPLANTKSKVDNVPYTLGVFASLVSHVGKTVTETFESVFSRPDCLPDYMPYHKTGTVFASALMSQVGQFRIVDPVFKGNMERFVNQCIVYDALIAHKYTLNDLQNTPDIWGLVFSKSSPVLGFLYKEGNTPGRIVTCKAGAEELGKLWNAQIKRATAVHGGRVNSRVLTENAFNAHLMGSARLLSKAQTIAKSATELLRQEMMMNALEDAANNKLSELKSPANYAATKALLQQRSAYAIAGEIAARTLPLFKNVIEALSYALFIFIVVLSLLPNGHQVLLTYCGILVWTQLWAPLYAVLNLIMTVYGRDETIAHGFQKGLTLLNSSAIINANADMVTLAAWLAVSIPFISYGILKQGAAAFVGLAQHLGSAMQSAASGAAAETVSGNISLGNVSLGTQAYQNTTAFQHNTSPSYNASQFKAAGIDGMEITTHADGGQTFQDQAVSQFPVQIMGTSNESIEQQKRLSHARSVSDARSITAGKSIEAAYQQSANFFSQVGQDAFAGENYHKSLTASESKALQNHKNLMEDLQKNEHMNEAQAFEAAFYAKAGTPEWLPVNAGTSGNFSSNAALQEGITTAKSIAEQRGYSENMDTVLGAAMSVAEGKNDTQAKTLGAGAMASLNEAQMRREEASVAHSKVDEISNSIASSQSSGIQVTKNLTKPFQDYVANQPALDGLGEGGKIGQRGAAEILRQGGEEFETYFKQFQKDNPQYSIQRVNVAGAQEKLSAQYQAASGQLGTHEAFEGHYSHHRETVQEAGKHAGLNLNAPPPTANAGAKAAIQWQGERPFEVKETSTSNQESSQNSSLGSQLQNQFPLSLKEEVRQQIMRDETQVEKGKENIATQKDSLEKDLKVSKEKTLAGTAYKNLGLKTLEGLKSLDGDTEGAKSSLPLDPFIYP